MQEAVVKKRKVPDENISEWYVKLGSPQYVLSPMVGQSELAFRMLCRKHGVQLAYTPMLSSDLFATSKAYRRSLFQTCPKDRPLVAQFCGNDPILMCKAAKKIENFVDAVDVNLGCPQEVAKRGGYGAYLMDDVNKVVDIVKTLRKNLNVPITCKIRRFKDYSETLRYALRIQNAGCSLITVHPRQRLEREEVMADWTFIKRLKRDLSIPVIANGDMWHAADVELCRYQTGADGFMSAQGLLFNPALFEPLGSIEKKSKTETKVVESKEIPAYMRHRRKYGPFVTPSVTVSFDRNDEGDNHWSTQALASSVFCCTSQDVRRQFELAREYVALCKKYPPCHFSVVKRHIFFILFDCIQANSDLYDTLCEMETLEYMLPLVEALSQRAESNKMMKHKGKDKSRARRRDGSLAPPPWPVGGGNKGICDLSVKPTKSKGKKTK